jgi:hypothetical protein
LQQFEKTGDPDMTSGKGAPGTAKLLQNGELVGTVEMDATVPAIFSAEGMSVGRDYGDSVSKKIYLPPNDFTGTVKQVAFDLSDDAIDNAEAEARRAVAAMAKQ